MRALDCAQMSNQIEEFPGSNLWHVKCSEVRVVTTPIQPC
ncbi:uncharacterized protein J3R85_005358 [Psidium guajava]|nr:uncharacterized protein J3R85_005358 [Psidium guajava]